MNFIFKLFGWFFSNLLLIIIVVAACYAFVYWDDPFGKDTPAGKVMAAFPEQTETVKSFVGKLMITEEDGPVLVEETVDESSTVIVSEDATDSDAGEEAAAVEAPQVAASLNGDVVSQSSGVAVEPSEEMRVASEADQSGFVTPEIEQALNNIKEDGSTTGAAASSPDPSAVTEAAPAQLAQAASPASAADDASPAASTAEQDASRELMVDARRAYYRRDYDTCIAAYEKLISMEKDNFDALGELGNVYFNKGDMQKAADAYYQAATIMVAQGQVRRAASLVGFLRSVDEEKADKLKQSIEQSNESPESL